MRILFDQGTPVPLRVSLAAHQIETARQHGWSELLNGELLAAAVGKLGSVLTIDTRLLNYAITLGPNLSDLTPLV